MILGMGKNENVIIISIHLTIMGLQRDFYKACDTGDLVRVQHLCGLSEVHPTADDNYAVRLASHCGQLDVVKYLRGLHGVDPTGNNNYAVRWASHCGHLEVVKYLCGLRRELPW